MASEAFLYVQEKCHISIFIYPLHSFSDVMSISYCTHFPFYQITLHLFCIIFELLNFQTLKLLTQEDYMLPTYRYSDITAITGVGEFISYWIIAVRKKNPDLESIQYQILFFDRYQKNLSSFRITLGYSSCHSYYSIDLRCRLLITHCLYLIYSKLV